MCRRVLLSSANKAALPSRKAPPAQRIGHAVPRQVRGLSHLDCDFLYLPCELGLLRPIPNTQRDRCLVVEARNRRIQPLFRLTGQQLYLNLPRSRVDFSESRGSRPIRRFVEFFARFLPAPLIDNLG